MASNEVNVRLASRSDLPHIISLIQERDGCRHPDDAIASYLMGLDPDRIRVWLAFVGDQPVAMNAMYLRRLRFGHDVYPVGYWAHLYVGNPYRKLMLYPRFVLEMFQFARSNGLNLIYTAMRRKNVTDAHVKLGFKELGTVDVLCKPLRPFALVAKRLDLPSWSVNLLRPFDGMFTAITRIFARQQGLEATDGDAIGVQFSDRIIDVYRKGEPEQLRIEWTTDYWNSRFACTIEGNSYQMAVATRSDEPSAVLYRYGSREDSQVGVIMDLIGHHDRDLSVRLLRHVEEKARLSSSEALLLMSNSLEVRSMARRAGYLRSPESYKVIGWSPNEARRIAVPFEQWHFSFADHDAF